MKKITLIHFIPVTILSLILLSMLFSPYWRSLPKEYEELRKELATPKLFNKPTIHFQRASEWIEFQILESF